MKTILIPIDCSQSSVFALDLAFRIALKSDCDLQLLNVAQLPDTDFQPKNEIIEADKEILLEAHKKELEAFMEHYESIRNLDEFRHLSVVYEIVSGQVEHEIVKYANKIEAHLIVIGSHGKQQSYDKEMGSVAQSLIGSTKTPIIAVPFRIKMEEIDMKEFVYAIDYLSNDYNQLFFILGLADVFNAHLHILNVSSNQLALTEGTEKWFKRTQNKMIDYHSVTFNHLSGADDIQKSIVSFCKENNISLLGVTTKHNMEQAATVKGSVSRPLTRLLDIPILYFFE